MNSKLSIRIGITNDAPIWLEFEPISGGQAKVYLWQDEDLKGYATVFVSDLRAAIGTLETIR